MATAKKQRATNAGRARRKVARKSVRKVARKRPSAKKAVSKRRPAARKRIETRARVVICEAAPPPIQAVQPIAASVPRRRSSALAAMASPHEVRSQGAQLLVAMARVSHSISRCRCGQPAIPTDGQCYECSRGD